MKKSMLAVFVAMSLAGPLAAAEPSRQISVSGSGRVAASPDVASISLGVTQESKTAGDAMSAASEAAAKVLDILAGFGIEPRDIQTRNVNLSPVWSAKNANTGRRQITGYEARNSLNVKVRDLDQLGEILNAAVAAGGNDFNGLSFSVRDPSRLIEDARRKAVADAMDKAGQLASAAGIKLGPVLSISESYGASPEPMVMEMAAARDSVPIAAGEVSFSVSVSMDFGIAE